MTINNYVHSIARRHKVRAVRIGQRFHYVVSSARLARGHLDADRCDPYRSAKHLAVVSDLARRAKRLAEVELR